MSAKEKEVLLSAYQHIKQKHEYNLKGCEDAYEEAKTEDAKEGFKNRIIINLKNIIDIDNKIIEVYKQ